MAQIRQAPITVQNVVTYDVVIGVSNADLALLPGMTANVRIVTGERSGALAVPLRGTRQLLASPTGKRLDVPLQSSSNRRRTRRTPRARPPAEPDPTDR